MIALGFDPGLATTGYGVVKKINSRYYHIASWNYPNTINKVYS
jgi:Holliday junction resolvasome RuvABC endonuclease subunit